MPCRLTASVLVTASGLMRNKILRRQHFALQRPLPTPADCLPHNLERETYALHTNWPVQSDDRNVQCRYPLEVTQEFLHPMLAPVPEGNGLFYFSKTPILHGLSAA